MDDLIKRLKCGVATRAQAMGGFTFDISATGEMIREAAAALADAQATIARLEAENARLRSLLGRYAEHVGSQEGVDFLENLLPAGFDPPPNLGQRSPYKSLLTESDAAEIRRCSAALSPREGEG